MPRPTAPTQPWPKPDEFNPAANSSQRRVAPLLNNASAAVAAHNGEADTFAGSWPTSFSKGLPHDAHGIVDAQAYSEFLEEVADPTYTDNAGNRVALFDMPAYSGPFRTKPTTGCADFLWRAWESPISGHPFGFTGPDAGALGIAPAPRLGSDELAAEMAELYAMAYLRDVPFEAIREGAQGADKVVSALGQMAWFQSDASPKDADGERLSKVSEARRVRDGGALTTQSLFRGSSQGCAQGPYVSQFLLQGQERLADCKVTSAQQLSDQPDMSPVLRRNGLSPFGALRIDQRIDPQTAGVDYMRDWAEWLDVQNGADTTAEQAIDAEGLKLIETPRDLACYVHSETTCQAYLNACLLLLSWGATVDEGLSASGTDCRRDAVTWAGPRTLTLLAETATRALRAVKNQTFQVHNRARPEKLGSIASLVANGHGAVLGRSQPLANAHLSKLESAASRGFNLMSAIARAPSEPRFSHNVNSQNGLPANDRNLLLPMAYPEGSPMHPSYGAAHATVAGACVTVLKAFFRTHSSDGTRLTLADAGAYAVYVPESGGKSLVPTKRPEDALDNLTLNGELNKLAANIAIGRSMAGVHYYSDYFESVRMGERIAVGMLAEHLAMQSENSKVSIETFDGDRLSIIGSDEHDSEIHVQNSTPELWWTRHLPEQAGW
ncbi:hypothetical protein [uncultured Ruegeria sp.]|uniref:hypothetical protein n=1 Tax=uncultured Ruegeria sp. TaxID=259304 RepID=UPI00262AEBB4|nr:hypothetical protein [uncultured Ruegeria sp.]